MKHLRTLSFAAGIVAAAGLSGCVIAPVGPYGQPGVYVRPAIVFAPPVVVVPGRYHYPAPRHWRRW